MFHPVGPAKRGINRARIELAMLDFRAEHCQLTTRAQSDSLFGNARLPNFHPCSSLRFAIGGYPMDRGLNRHRQLLY